MADFIDILKALTAQGPTPGLPEMSLPATLPPIPTPGDPGSSSLAFAPVQADPSIMAQLMQFAPQLPAPPVIQQPGFLEKLSTILGGVGAGLQGQAPQYLAQLREQRERPQREYQRQLERAEGIRRDIGLEGVQETRRDVTRRQKEQRETEKEFQASQKPAERETRVVGDALVDVMTGRPIYQAPAKAAPERAPRWAFDLDGLPYNLNNPEERKAFTALPKNKRVKPEKGKAATGQTAGQMIDQFEILKRQLYPARDRGDRAAENRISGKMAELGAKLERVGYEVGLGPDPYVKPRGQAGPSAPQAQVETATMDQVRAYAIENNISEAEALADFRKQQIQVK